MATITFSGECWISDAAERPDLDDDGRFGARWNHIGRIGSGERALWDEIRKPSRRSAEFYIAIFQDELTVLPPRFWLGVEWLTDQLYVASGPAAPRTLARRAPEPHPGLIDRPVRYVSARVTAATGRSLFERLR